jgi:hypothetical protein
MPAGSGPQVIRVTGVSITASEVVLEVETTAPVA